MKTSTRRPRLRQATKSAQQPTAWRGCQQCDGQPGLCARCTRPIPYALTPEIIVAGLLGTRDGMTTWH